MREQRCKTNLFCSLDLNSASAANFITDKFWSFFIFNKLYLALKEEIIENKQVQLKTKHII